MSFRIEGISGAGSEGGDEVEVGDVREDGVVGDEGDSEVEGCGGDPAVGFVVFLAESVAGCQGPVS
jgi:hypothetical protein